MTTGSVPATEARRGTTLEQSVTADRVALSAYQDAQDQALQLDSNDSDPQPAATTDHDRYTLAELEQLALQNNPALQELYASIQAAQGIRYQVGTKANPTVGYFGSQIADAGTDQHGVFIDQQWIRGDKLRLNQGILDQTVHRLSHELEVQRFRILTDIRQLFADALAAQETEEFCREFSKELAKGVRVAEERKRIGEGTNAEVLQVTIFYKEVDLLMQQSHQRWLGAWNELIAIAGAPDIIASQLDRESVDAFLTDITQQQLHDDRIQWILQASPELGSAHARVAEARAVLVRQQAQTIPNINVQFGAGSDNGTGSSMINLQMGAPLPVHNQNRGNIQAACAEYNRAVLAVRRIELSLRARFARSEQELRNAVITLEQTQQSIVPSAVESLRLAELAYQAGELEFLNVFVARRTYFDARVKEINARRDVFRAHSQIEGMLLSGGLDAPDQNNRDDATRGQSLDGQ